MDRGSYLTPVSAFSEWPDLPNRQTATFPCTQDGRDEAAAWLTKARRRIEADVWEPERIAKRKAKDHALTFAEYTAKWLKTREGEGLHTNTIYSIRCTVKRLTAVFGDMPIGKITSADIERFAATLPKDHPYVGRELLSKLRQILDAAATPDQDGIAVIAKSPFAMQVRKPAPRRRHPPPHHSSSGGSTTPCHANSGSPSPSPSPAEACASARSAPSNAATSTSTTVSSTSAAPDSPAPASSPGRRRPPEANAPNQSPKPSSPKSARTSPNMWPTSRTHGYSPAAGP